MEEGLRIESLIGEPLEVMGEEVFQGNRGRAALAKIDQDGYPDLAWGLLGFRGELSCQMLAEAAFAAAEVPEEGQKGRGGMFQPFKDGLCQPLGLWIFNRDDLLFEDSVLLDVEVL